MSPTTATDDHPAPVAGDEHVHEHPSDAKYIQIAAILFVITAAEVATYYVDLSTTALVIALLPMMTVKFAIVARWFMHLRFDNKLFSRFFVGGLVLAVIVYMIALSTFRFFS